MSRTWLMRAWTTIAIFWALWMVAVTWWGLHRQAVLTMGSRVIGMIDDPVSRGEWLRATAISTAVALFFVFLAWLWLRPAKAESYP